MKRRRTKKRIEGEWEGGGEEYEIYHGDYGWIFTERYTSIKQSTS